jgi:hypothetical protein
MRYVAKVSLKRHTRSLLPRFHVFMNDELKAESHGNSLYKQILPEQEYVSVTRLETGYYGMQSMNTNTTKLNTVIWVYGLFTRHPASFCEIYQL